MTGNGLSGQALRDLGVLHSGFTPNSAHYTDLLALLNQILDSWSTEGLSVFSIQRSTHSLTSGDEDYTLGSGGDFNTTRPAFIQAAGRIPASGADEKPLALLSLAEYQRESDGLYVNMDFPLIQLSIRPTPGSGETLVLYSGEALAAFADGTTVYTFPPGYERAMRTALAVAAIPMMSMYIKAAAPQLDRLERDAAAAKRAIQRLNLRPVRTTCDPALVGMGSFDPRTWRTL